jgi:hypothetical protein
VKKNDIRLKPEVRLRTGETLNPIGEKKNDIYLEPEVILRTGEALKD